MLEAAATSDRPCDGRASPNAPEAAIAARLGLVDPNIDGDMSKSFHEFSGKEDVCG